MDRIDLRLEAPSLRESDLEGAPHGDSSQTVLERDVRAHDAQDDRRRMPDVQLTGHEIEERVELQPEAWQILRDANSQFGPSVRVLHRAKKTVRKIAGLERSLSVRLEPFAKALQYRAICSRQARAAPRNLPDRNPAGAGKNVKENSLELINVKMRQWIVGAEFARSKTKVSSQKRMD